MSGGLLCKGGLLMRTGSSLAVGLGVNETGAFFTPGTWEHDIGSLLGMWLVTAVSAISLATFGSAVLFWRYYWAPTYEQWTRKSNPKFPGPEKVRDEIVQMLKGMVIGALCPAISVWLAGRGSFTKGYCGMPDDVSLAQQVGGFFFVWFASDFCEFFYHWLGHVVRPFWNVHKHHHVFFNPTPFAVVADEFFDQFNRALPMLIFPILLPLNIDVAFLTFSVFFYGYGLYLHWGYELDAISAHHPVLNTAFQHYAHHAKSVFGKPYHCGFMFKIWDQLFGAVWAGPCFCAKCEREAGRRTREQFAKIVKPDYSVLLRPSFWLQKGVWTGITSTESNDLVGKDYHPLKEKQ